MSESAWSIRSYVRSFRHGGACNGAGHAGPRLSCGPSRACSLHIEDAKKLIGLRVSDRPTCGHPPLQHRARRVGLRSVRTARSARARSVRRGQGVIAVARRRVTSGPPAGGRFTCGRPPLAAAPRAPRGTACRACSSPHMRSLGPPSLSARPRPSCWHSESLLCRYRDRVGGRLRVLAAAPPVASPGGCPTCGSHFSGPPLPGAHESRCVLLKLFYA